MMWKGNLQPANQVSEQGVTALQDLLSGLILYYQTHMFEQTFKNIDDILYKDSGADSELDFIVTPTNHCNIAREEEVLRQIAFFFVHGTFDELPAKWREACSRNAPALGRKLIARPERRFRFRSGKGAR